MRGKTARYRLQVGPGSTPERFSRIKQQTWSGSLKRILKVLRRLPKYKLDFCKFWVQDLWDARKWVRMPADPHLLALDPVAFRLEVPSFSEFLTRQSSYDSALAGDNEPVKVLPTEPDGVVDLSPNRVGSAP